MPADQGVDRRRAVGGLVAAAGAAWVAPQLASVPAAAAATSASCSLCGTNLVRNASGEMYSPDGSADEDPNPPDANPGPLPVLGVPWTTTNGFRVVDYGHTTFPTDSQLFGAPVGQAPTPGDVMFCGSLNGAASPATATQAIDDLAACAEAIATGELRFTFSAFLGGNPAFANTMLASARFFDDGGDPVGPTVNLGPVTAAQMTQGVGLYYRQESGFVPVGTVEIQVTLTATRNPVDDLTNPRNNAAADLISFSFC